MLGTDIVESVETGNVLLDQTSTTLASLDSTGRTATLRPIPFLIRPMLFPEEIFAGGRRERRFQAKSLFCFWAVRELGVSLTDLARRLGMSPAGVGYAVERGEVMARERRYQLTP